MVVQSRFRAPGRPKLLWKELNQPLALVVEDGSVFFPVSALHKMWPPRQAVHRRHGATDLVVTEAYSRLLGTWWGHDTGAEGVRNTGLQDVPARRAQSRTGGWAPARS